MLLDAPCSEACMEATKLKEAEWQKAERQDRMFTLFRDWRLTRSEDFETLAYTCFGDLEERKTHAIKLTLSCCAESASPFTATSAELVPIDELEGASAGGNKFFLDWLASTDEFNPERTLCLFMFQVQDPPSGFPKICVDSCDLNAGLWSSNAQRKPLENVLDRMNSQIIFLSRDGVQGAAAQPA